MLSRLFLFLCVGVPESNTFLLPSRDGLLVCAGDIFWVCSVLSLHALLWHSHFPLVVHCLVPLLWHSVVSVGGHLLCPVGLLSLVVESVINIYLFPIFREIILGIFKR